MPKGDLLFVLESALRLSGSALVRDKRGYIIVPAAEAVGSGSSDAAERGEAGFGVTVIPLQYVSAATLARLLDSFAAKPGTIRVDNARNLVLVQGSGPERRNATETVLSFDTDWMKGQSVGIYPVRNSTPEPIISELERIMDAGEGGLSASLVKLQPIARLNAIMVVTSKPALLKTTATWITRLDKSDTASTGVKVYNVRYGDARQMATLLNDIFGGGRAVAARSTARPIRSRPAPASRPRPARRSSRAACASRGAHAARCVVVRIRASAAARAAPLSRRRRAARQTSLRAVAALRSAAAAALEQQAASAPRQHAASAAAAAPAEASCRACASPRTRSTIRC